MARSFIRANADVLTAGSAAATAPPFTMASWFRTDNIAVQQILTGFSTSGSANNFFSLSMSSTGAIQATAQTTSGAAATSSTVVGAANVWHHATAVFTSSASRAAYLDGGGKGTNTTNKSPTAPNRTTISSPTSSVAMSGRIAEVAIWNVALTDAEILALSGGLAPPYVQPGALIGYWPVWGLHSPEIDLTANNRTMTLTGTAQADHAPVQPFSHRRWGTAPLIEVAVATGALSRRSLDPRIARRDMIGG